MNKVVSKLLLVPLAATLALLVGIANPPAAVEAQAPEVYISTPVPSVLIDKGKLVTFSIDIHNRSTVGKAVDMAIVSAPQGWEPVMRTRGFVARSVFVPGATKDGDGLVSVDLQVKAPAEAKVEDHEFQIRASGAGVDTSILKLVVGVKTQPTVGSSLVAQYPSVRGKSGGKFEFKADLRNDSEEERSYGLSFKGPEGWDVTFQPSYEQKQISDVRLKSGSSQGLDIQVQPPLRVAAGEYPVTVTAASNADRAVADLKVVVTGSYQMEMLTRTQTFNTSATAGQESPFYVTVVNAGSAPLQDVALASNKPEGWTVTFNPAKIDSLEPGAKRELAMLIKPAAKAIAGDYMLNVSATHPQVTLNRDVRVSVETPAVWGWVGMGVLVLVIGGLLGLFLKLGRR